MSSPKYLDSRSQTDSASDTKKVEIDDLTKSYADSGNKEVIAVNNLSIDIFDGEFLVIVGPSGCGKSTTLRTIAGLEKPTDGTIRINQRNVTGLEPRQRDISMVFQNYALYPHKTVRKNISFPLEVRGFDKDEISGRVEDTAKILDITDLLDRKPNQLSGGQQQRVSLGRAIVREPAVFLMDEPLSNLDAKLRTKMRTELKELHQKVAKTTVYVTHNQAEAMTLGDRVLVLDGGEMQQIGPPQELYDNPINMFVAGFIGEPAMNFIPLDLLSESGMCRADSYDLSINMSDYITRKSNQIDKQSNDIILGVRPEDIYISDDTRQVDNLSSKFEIKVKIIETLGSDMILTLNPPDYNKPNIKSRVSPQLEIGVGDLAEASIDLDKVHLFDKMSGNNITR
jgi:multiple sugar transport system ATP-binding protein